MTTTALHLPPGLLPGTWRIDPVHSDISFVARHMMVSRVRGSFTRFEGTIRISDDVVGSSAEATVDMNSVDTRNEQRDADIRSANFFDVATYPTMTFRSTRIRAGNGAEDFLVDGDLSVHGVTGPVVLATAFNGVGPDPWGGTRAGFSARTALSRKDFGVVIDLPMEGGGVVVGDRINVEIEVEAVFQGES